jgi:sulfur carrier protein ThiS
VGGHLRKEIGDRPQEFGLTLPTGATIHDALDVLGLSAERVKIVLRNGRPSPLDTVLAHNDRLGLFPPELAYNTFVAVSLTRRAPNPTED